MVSEEAAVRFVMPFEDGDENPDAHVVVSRVEGSRPCGGCGRLHAYQIGVTDRGEERSRESVLVDSLRDARTHAWRWLPDSPVYFGHRQPENDQGPAVEVVFDNRREAIEWLLA